MVAVSSIDLNISKNVFVPLYYPYLFNYDNRYEVYYIEVAFKRAKRKTNDTFDAQANQSTERFAC